MAKPCLSKRSSGHIIPLLGTRETLPPSAGSLLGSQKVGAPLLVDDDKALPPMGLWAGIQFGKILHQRVGEYPRAGQAWGKKNIYLAKSK